MLFQPQDYLHYWIMFCQCLCEYSSSPFSHFYFELLLLNTCWSCLVCYPHFITCHSYFIFICFMSHFGWFLPTFALILVFLVFAKGFGLLFNLSLSLILMAIYFHIWNFCFYSRIFCFGFIMLVHYEFDSFHYLSNIFILKSLGEYSIGCYLLHELTLFYAVGDNEAYLVIFNMGCLSQEC